MRSKHANQTLMQSLVVTVALIASTASVAAGEASFALVIGTNASVDKDLEPLRYADDDAARTFDLFRALGARTYLASRLDDETARLHPQAAAEAVDPTDTELSLMVKKIAGHVAVARARGLTTTFYVFYAGHGNIDGSRGYITLEDARLYGDDIIDRLLTQVNAAQSHVIVDACHSYYLAYGRGPGGARREAKDFTRLVALADEGRVGLLLSTSSAAESHEWEAYQAGVFSHEIRSGLYGAADANGDGVVSYREIAAFVEKANVAIPNERYRPKLHTRAPKGNDALISISTSDDAGWLDVDGKNSGHYLLETEFGVRLLDFHSAPGEPIRVVRARGDRLFLRRIVDDIEFEIPPDDQEVNLAKLTPQPMRVQGRGAAHHSFSLLFSEPFSMTDVIRYQNADTVVDDVGLDWGLLVGVPTIAVAAGLGVVGVGALAAGTYVMATTSPSASQASIAETNQLIIAADVAAASLLVGAVGVAGLGTALILFLPDAGE